MNRARALLAAMSVLRVAIGGAAMVVPGLLAREWIGRPADSPGARVLSRSMGARDAALGFGALLAMRHDAPVRGWVLAAGLADAGDAVATLLAFPSLPKRGRAIVLPFALSAVIAARLLAPRVD